MVTLASDAPLGSGVVRLAKIHRRWVAAALEELGLYVGQDLMLTQLHHREGASQTALAQSLGVELPTVHRTLSRLEAAGFVERRVDPSDARSSLTYLTTRGREVCTRIQEIWREADHRLGSAMPREDAAELRRLLGTLIKRLDHT